MIFLAFGVLYLAIGVITQIGLVRAHKRDGVEFKEFWPGRWERVGITLATIAAWPYVLYSWFGKPAIEIPDR